MDHTL